MPARDLKTTWRDSDRLVPRTFVRPVLRLLDVEAASAGIMLVAAVAALLWANSAWHGSYEQLWETELVVRLGDVVDLDLGLREWVNGAAMALFFLLAGLEIKRQLFLGELRNPRAAALPAMAALGGMVMPALIYVAINRGHPGADGWGIPVATDIAFAIGVVTLVGRRVPLGARIFVLTLAVVDDVGGIVVIALFYADGVSLGWLMVAAFAIAAAYLCRRGDVRSLAPYIALGALCWLAFHEAGIESAIVGVVFGLLTPIRPFHEPRAFVPAGRALLADVERAYADDDISDEERERNEDAVEELARLALETSSPLERVENRLGPWVTLLVVPVFAFANAGVRIETDALDGRVVLGVVLGLVAGKTVGVMGFSWLAVRLGIGQFPAGTTWAHLFGLAVTAGIGFTVALFVTSLSFDDAGLTASAKLGVLAASALAGVLGFLALRFLTPDRAPSASGRQDASTWTPSGSSATS
jgi:NhaA family Na+:H+ antiporter